MSSLIFRTEEEAPRGSTASAVAVMRPLVVVEAQEAVEGELELRELREIAAAKLDAPVLMRNRSLQSFDETVGPGMARLCARVADAELSACLSESPLNSLPPSVSTRSIGQPASR